MILTIISAVLLLSVLGFIFGAILAFIAKKFAVTMDERIVEVLEELPGINCGACGYPGCSALAKSIVAGDAEVNSCIPAGANAARKIAGIMGQEIKEREPMVAVARCSGGSKTAVDKYIYKGLMNCRAAYILGGGPKQCKYGCIGLGSCVKECPFGALKLNDNHIPVTDFNKCTGCGICVKICPHNVMLLIPRSQEIYVACNSPDKPAVTRKACSTGCIGCKLCQKNCPREAIEMDGFLARVIPENCIECGVCIENCPNYCILDRGTGVALPEPARMTRKRLEEMKKLK